MSAPYRTLLRTVYGLADAELGLLPAEPLPFQHVTPQAVPRMTPEVGAYFESLFAEHVRADNLIGPRLVLDVVSHQAETLRSSVRQARGAEREQAVRLASRYEEFLGWLNQDAGRPCQAMIHTDRARDLATELRDPPLAAYLLMRKSNIATDSGDPVLALALAGLGQGQACDDVATEALESVAAGRVWPDESSLAPYCTTGYVAMEAAACWLQLGQPDQALTMFALAPPAWPDGLRRDHGLHLARRATAHAGVRDVDAACDLAEQSLRTVRQTGSARTIRELRRLSHQLSLWQSRGDVTAVTAAVATLVGSGA